MKEKRRSLYFKLHVAKCFLANVKRCRENFRCLDTTVMTMIKLEIPNVRILGLHFLRLTFFIM